MDSLGDAPIISFILTTDRARAKPFYIGALGLTLVSEDAFATTLALAGGATLRLTELPGHAPGAHTVCGWNVPDIRAAVAALRTKGISFTIYDGFGQDDDGIWEPPGGGAKVAWFTDPDGNVLSLTQFG